MRARVPRAQATDEREGTTALHRAAYGGHVAAVEALLAAGAHLEATSRRNGATPLHLAARASRAEVVVRLLNAGAALGHRNKRGESPLSVATDPLTIRSLLVRRARTHAAPRKLACACVIVVAAAPPLGRVLARRR
jgi:ankyrin repeat protein